MGRFHSRKVLYIKANILKYGDDFRDLPPENGRADLQKVGGHTSADSDPAARLKSFPTCCLLLKLLTRRLHELHSEIDRQF